MSKLLYCNCIKLQSHHDDDYGQSLFTQNKSQSPCEYQHLWPMCKSPSDEHMAIHFKPRHLAQCSFFASLSHGQLIALYHCQLFEGCSLGCLRIIMSHNCNFHLDVHCTITICCNLLKKLYGMFKFFIAIAQTSIIQGFGNFQIMVYYP